MLKKETKKRVLKIIEEKYLTESEFIVEELAPEIDEEEFDVDELVDIMNDIRTERDIKMRN